MKCDNPDCPNEVTDPHHHLKVCEACWISSGGNPEYYKAAMQVHPSNFRYAMKPTKPDNIMAIIHTKSR
jgi:hypothetical protein